MPVAAPPITIPVELRSRFQRNLAALSLHQPEVAARLAVTPLPENIVPTVGRDGQMTFRVSSAGGQWAWFGGSSMPSISAAEILAEISGDGGNVILPAVMTGHEPLALLHRAPRTAAVFVVEPQAVNLVMAMHLCDYALAIESGRLIFFPLSTLHADLTALFRRYPGYVMPIRMITSPLLKHGQTEVIQRQIGEAAQTVYSIQNDLMAEAQSRLAACKPGALSPQPRIAVLDAGSGQSSAENMQSIASALGELHWPSVVVIRNHPRRMHTAATLREVAALKPEVFFCINGIGARMTDSVWAEAPTISWFLPEAALVGEVPGKEADRSMIFASSSRQRDMLVDRGFPPEGLAVCPIGLDVAADAITPDESRDRQDPLASCLVIAPAMDDQPQALNVTLHSHVRLWNRLKEMAGFEAAENDRRETDSSVRQAMHDIGMTGADPNVVDFFARVFVERLLPAAHLRMAQAELGRFAPATRAWSPEAFREWALARRGRSTSELTARAAPDSTVSLAIIPCDFAQKALCVLEALAVGMAVILHVTTNDAVSESLDFPDLSPLIFGYRSQSDLADAIGRAAAVCVATRTEIARRTRTAHTMTKRLEFMIMTLRRRLESAAFA